LDDSVEIVCFHFDEKDLGVCAYFYLFISFQIRLATQGVSTI